MYRICSLFAGVGGIDLGFLNTKKCKVVYANEFDPYAKKTYELNFKNKIDCRDIHEVKLEEIPEFDIMVGGFPCTSFSVAGYRKGFQDDKTGDLFFEMERIFKERKPRVIFLENVKNLARHDGGKTLSVIKKTLDEIGYDVFDEVLDASKYGVPQSRKRIYIVCFRKDLKIKEFDFPKEENLKKHVMDILLPDSETKKYEIHRNDIVINQNVKEKISDIPLRIGTVNKGGQGERIYSPLGTAITLSAYGGGAGAKTGLYRVNGKIRKLAPRECARLDGFPENFKIAERDTVAYKQFGNSVVVDVLQKIMKNALEKKEVVACL